MAKHTILIRVVRSPAEQMDLIHRFKNLGEDVYYYVSASGKGGGEVDIQEVDAAPDHFSVRRVRRVQVRRVVGWLEKEAARQNLQIVIEVS